MTNGEVLIRAVNFAKIFVSHQAANGLAGYGAVQKTDEGIAVDLFDLILVRHTIVVGYFGRVGDSRHRAFLLGVLKKNIILGFISFSQNKGNT